MKVLFLLTNPAASPGERYRILQYLPRLEDLGIEPRVNTLLTDDVYRRLQAPRGRAVAAAKIATAAVARLTKLLQTDPVDLVVMYRQPVDPPPHLLERMLRRKRLPFLFDFDDAIFLPPPSPVSRVSGFLRSPARVPELIRGAKLTTVGNDYLASFARRHSDGVHIVPTCVDAERYEPRQHRDGSRTVLGWVGSRSTAAYLHELDDVWKLISREGYVLRVVGGSYDTANIQIEERPWALETELTDLAEFDIGLMPLPDDPWTRGKCGLKILQYMAAGIPTVASPVGVNVEIIEHGVNGFLASTPQEWVDAIAALAADASLRTRIGAAGRATVEERYSLKSWAPRFAEMMKRAAA